MSTETGYIKLWRSLATWEWYGDINTTRLFLHLLITVNYKPGKWRGKVIERGQRATSVPKLAEETGLTMREIRTAMNHLKSTREVTCEATNRYTIITVENYSRYQEVESENDKQNDAPQDRQQTKRRHSNDILTTTIKKEKEKKESKKGKKEEIYTRELTAYTENEFLRGSLMDFAAMRKEIKSPLTERATQLLLSKLSQLADSDEEKIAILEQSVINGWKGIFPLKNGVAPAKAAASSNPFLDLLKEENGG